MSDEISSPSEAPAVKRRSKKRTIALIAVAAVVLAGGITATSVAVAQAEAEETLRQCTVALKSGAAAAKTATESVADAENALESVAITALPDTDGWISANYADRPGAEAVDAIEAVEASEGVPAQEAVDAVPARSSGAEQIAAVTDASVELSNVVIPDECTDRDEAAALTKLATEATADAAALDETTTTLTEDFAVFQAEETARIAAEIEAARLAAEAEAARLAEEEARRLASEEAARQQNANSNGGSNGGSSNNNGGSRPPANSGGTKPGGGGPPGGGQVGGSGGCVVDNGMGGTRPC
ncbi:hypothetical protein [Microbacterium sp. LWH13-1.2]|uniref:hypothetical protein n=1 Tax=Microbacterium sp. LWH13-1.2 TaxID=3135260 RepID=UPI003139C281